jgi:hypothetical protein
MTRDDIINLARQHGKPVQEQNAEVEYLFMLEGVNALLAAEREACAKPLEEAAQSLTSAKRTNGVDRHVADVLTRHAAAIRARNKL